MPQAEDTVFRKLFAAHQPGPCPLDVDSLELALFAVGWDALLRDLRIALPPDAFKSAEAVLSAHSLRNAMVCRDNLVHYKKALLGLHQSSQNTSRDLRRLATFYREPPAEYVDRNRRDGGRGLQRPEPYCTLSDALCTTEGVSGGMLDGRLYIKAVCCLTRHPDAPPTAAWQSKEQARPQYGQPLNHVRCAGLLSEALPGALRGWRLLREARHALRHSQVCARLDECMTRAAARLEELGSDEVPSGWPVLLAALQRLNLPAGCFWWVRCVLIARGGAKALAIVARASWLSTVLRTLLEALVECEGMVREAAGEAAGEAAAEAAAEARGERREARESARAAGEAAAEARGERLKPLTAAEAKAAAEAEGLTLVTSAAASSGYTNVQWHQNGKHGSRRTYELKVVRGSRLVYLGTFATAEEAALVYARWLAKEESAAEVAAALEAVVAAVMAAGEPTKAPAAELAAVTDAAMAATVAPTAEGLLPPPRRRRRHNSAWRQQLAAKASATTADVMVSEKDVRRDAASEGLALVPSHCNSTGFHGVSFSPSSQGCRRPFSAQVWEAGNGQGTAKGRQLILGSYASAAEAALAYARHLGGPASLTAAAAADVAAVAAAAKTRMSQMSDDDVKSVAEAEGLVLVASSINPHGFKGVGLCWKRHQKDAAVDTLPEAPTRWVAQAKGILTHLVGYALAELRLPLRVPLCAEWPHVPASHSHRSFDQEAEIPGRI